MTAIRKMRVRRAMLLIAAIALVPALGCGNDDFRDDPRAPVPTVLTGVIKPDKLIVSPSKVGAGPVEITISNQTNEAHTVTLEGASVEERVGPVNPQDVARIQKTLERGTYEVRAGAEQAAVKEIAPARITVGKARAESNRRVLLP